MERPFFAFNDKYRFSAPVDTPTTQDQIATEALCERQADHFMPLNGSDWEKPVFYRGTHIAYLSAELERCSKALESSRPWVCYWIVHSLCLLDQPISDDVKTRLVHFLKSCEAPGGGYAGSPGQVAHIAPTYAAVLALVSLETEEALASINRKTLASFLVSLHQPDGSFRMHVGGEVDIRGVYCALAVASITHILSPEMVERTAEWLASCQTYQGGFGGVVGTEAHGGYTFCGVAALTILGKMKLINMNTLLKWLSNRQMAFEGGFSGRSNKLVDACYSFWQGAVFSLIDTELARENEPSLGKAFEARALEEYLMLCCQGGRGGLRDKPEKYCDPYHTCYALSGLSIAQRYIPANEELLCGPDEALKITHPVYNVTASSHHMADGYFANADSL
ncbi:unnamed protein product, partial [Mesorhabditis spiculigera]